MFRALLSATLAFGCFVSTAEAQCPAFPTLGVERAAPLGSYQWFFALALEPGSLFTYVAVPNPTGAPVQCTNAVHGVPCCFYGTEIGVLRMQMVSGPPAVQVSLLRVPNNNALLGSALVVHTGTIQLNNPLNIDRLSTERLVIVE
jgi:hypothetical protein